MRKIIFYTLPLIILIISCKKETINPEKKIINDSISIIKKTKAEPFVFEESKTALLLKNIQKKELEIKEKLKNTNQLEANFLYEDLKKFNNEQINLLSEVEMNLLDKYIQFYSEKYNKIVIPDSVKTKYNALKKQNIEFWDIGEGYTEFRFEADYYYSIFKGKVTPDYDYFIKTNANEDKVLFDADAGIAVSWEEVGHRVINWDLFLTNFPESKLSKQARETYMYYLNVYIFGEDNTPTIEDDGTKFYKENIEEINQFIEKNPSCKTTIFLKQTLDYFKKNRSRELLHKYYETESEKIFELK